MANKIIFLPSALEELKEIEDYYNLEFGKKTTEKVLKNILKTIDRLRDFPNSGSLTYDNALNEQGYRMVISKKYIAIYKYIFDTVYIYHIANQKRDYSKLF